MRVGTVRSIMILGTVMMLRMCVDAGHVSVLYILHRADISLEYGVLIWLLNHWCTIGPRDGK